MPINFDVKWVVANAHWQVNAYKTPPGTPVAQYHQSVAFSTRTINLYTSKLKRYTAANDAGARQCHAEPSLCIYKARRIRAAEETPLPSDVCLACESPEVELWLATFEETLLAQSEVDRFKNAAFDLVGQRRSQRTN